MIVQLRRHADTLSFATASTFSVMTLLEFFYFRSLSGRMPSLDLRF